MELPREIDTHLEAQTAAGNRRILKILTFVCFAMLGLGFASKPLYDTFCKVTGYGGTTRVADINNSAVSQRIIRVQFDTNTSRGLAWDFTSEKPHMDVNIGANNLAFFTATNSSKQVITATSNYNVSPIKAAPYFSKLECFCFTEQTLAPGESADYPVVFFLDPLLLEDERMDEVTTITLSYTFFPVEKKDAANSAPGDSALP
ncbi:MAG: cytochrome c oxidase assembly protein [Robiginitomaculum sp.]